MLSSLCPVMAAILSVSRFRFRVKAARRVTAILGWLGVSVAGSIGTAIVARLARMAAGPGVPGHHAAQAGRSRLWQAPAR